MILDSEVTNNDDKLIPGPTKPTNIDYFGCSNMITGKIYILEAILAAILESCDS